jgi:hypothetical protein
MVRAEAANDHPAFLDTMAEVVGGVVKRYERGRPLMIT